MVATVQSSGVLAKVVASEKPSPGSHRSAEARARHTQRVGLSRSARSVNVQGAFGVTQPGKGPIYGKGLVLVDDVQTSGATAGACARVLLRPGAPHVDVLVFTRVVATARVPI